MTTELIIALARVIARQDQEIADLKQTLDATSQAAAYAERSARFYRENTPVERQAVLDEACKRIDALRLTNNDPARDMGLMDAKEIIESLGSMDPDKRQADAVSDECIHKQKWSKAP